MHFNSPNSRHLWRTTVLCLSVFTLIASCGKEEKMEIPGNWEPANSLCSNGIQDGSETGVDCGGNCPPCPGLSIPCTVAQGTVVYDGNTFNVTSMIVLFDEVLINTSGGFTMNIRTGDDIAPGNVYTLTAAINPTGLNAHVVADEGPVEYRSQNGVGRLYVEGPSNDMTITICDADLRLFGGTDIKSLKFKKNE